MQITSPEEAGPREAALDQPVLGAVIIGAGFIGAVHAAAVRAVGGVVVGVADHSIDRAQRLRRRAMAERATTEPEELIGSADVDVVHICTSNAAHPELVEKAVRAQKHVICEKPLATNVAAARRLTELATERGLMAAVPFVYRYYPMVRELKARVREGQAGTLHLVHGYYLQDWLADQRDSNWRVDGSVGGSSRAFGDIGVHWADLLEYTSGHRISRLCAQLLTAFPVRGLPASPTEVHTEDVATVSFETDQGAIGSVVLSQVAHGYKNRIRLALEGAKASFVFDHDRPEVLWVGRRSGNYVLSRSSDGLSAAASRYVTLPAGHPQGYQDCFNAFVGDCYSAIRGEHPEGLPTFADGLRAAEITDAVLLSAARKSWVEVLSAPRRSLPGDDKGGRA